MADQRTAYDVIDRYDDAYFADLAQRYLTRNRFARQRIANVFSLMPHELRGCSFLDLGCGMGTFALEAAARGARALGVDMMPQALHAARRVREHVPGSTAQFALADATRLPVPDASFDIALAADLTEHLDDDTLQRVLTEAARALKPGGRLVIYTPESRHIFERLRDAGVMTQDSSHIGVRTGEELAARVRAAGFEVAALRYLPSHLPGWNLLERAFARRVPLLRRRIGIVARRPE